MNFVGIGIFLYLCHLILALLLADTRTLNEIKSHCFSSKYISGTLQNIMQVSYAEVNDTPLKLYKCITSTILISVPKHSAWYSFIKLIKFKLLYIYSYFTFYSLLFVCVYIYVFNFLPFSRSIVR